MVTATQSIVTKPPRGGARVALLNAALSLVRKQGWAATSIDELCAVAGATKGAFFHHFASKEELGVAAARHWSEVTAPLFANADYHRHPDPLDRIFGYLDFRTAIAQGPLEAFTCFAGTTVQEVFASSDAMRAACGQSIFAHAQCLAEDFRAALERHTTRMPVSAVSLANYTQSVLQGGFVLSKARGDNTPVVEALEHLKNYLTLLFSKEDAR